MPTTLAEKSPAPIDAPASHSEGRGLYRLPPTTQEDLNALSSWVKRFSCGEVTPGKFRGFRVPLGIYEQRGGQVYMLRVRLPGGAITAAQLRGLAGLAREYGVAPHVTTRQDIQLQNAPLEAVAPLCEALRSLGLTCKGGGGNTVRNIMACPDAGVCPHETFDVLPYAIALTDYLLLSPSSYNLPRKLKIAVSGCSGDGAMATVNDLGFIAKLQDGRLGFAVYAGGGMGGHSAVALKLHDFVPAEEAGSIAEAIKRLFDQHGDRSNKHQARLRFVVRRFGAVAFREEYERVLAQVKAEGGVALEFPAWSEQPPAATPAPHEEPGPGFESWRANRVSPQRQEGYFMARVPLGLGDLRPDTMERLADLLDALGLTTLRTTPSQDLMFRWVKGAALPLLHARLRDLNLVETGARSLDHMVCCKGADTCRQGLCLSGGLCQAVADELDAKRVDLEGMPEVRLFVSGCPNACGKHPVGAIGVYGVAGRVDGKAVPFYHVALGGRVREGDTQLAESRGRVPARNVPILLRRFLTSYQARRARYEGDFGRYLTAEGYGLMDELIEHYRHVPRYEEAPEFYRDFGRDEDFSLAGRGPGECGAGVFDMIESDLDEARAAYEEWNQSGSAEALFRATCSFARSLLVLRGVDSDDSEVILQAFRELFLESRWVAGRYTPLLDAAERYRRTGESEALAECAPLVSHLEDRLKTLYASIDAELRFRLEPEEPAPAAPALAGGAEGAPAIRLLDLRGVGCPANYVRAKLVLDQLAAAADLELLLDDGDPVYNVPSTLSMDGHRVLALDEENGYYRVRVQKGS